MSQHVQDSEWDGTKFGREQTTGVMLGLGKEQVIFLSIGAGLVLLVVIALSAPASVLLGIMIGLVFAGIGIPKVQGVALVVYLWRLMVYMLRGSKGQLEYVQRDDAETGALLPLLDEDPTSPVLGKKVGHEENNEVDRDKKGRLVPGTAQRFVLPGEAHELLAYTLPGGAGMVFNPRRGEALVSAKIRTTKGFDLESFDVQEERTGGWREAISAMMRTEGVVRMQATDQTTLMSSKSVKAWYERHSDAKGSGDDIDPFLHSSFLDLMDQAQDMPVHEKWLTIVISRGKIAQRIRANGGGLPGMMQMMLSVMATVETTVLRSGALVAAWHSPRSLAALSRSAFDPGSSVQISERSGDWVGAAPHSAGPMAMEVFKDSVTTDGYWHRTYKVSEFPQKQAQFGFLEALVFAGEFRHTVSVFYSPGEPRKALKTLQKRKADHNTTKTMLAKMHKEPSLEHVREREDIDAEEDQLVSGHAPVKLSVLITVTGSDEMELAANCDRVLQRAVESNCELRPLMLEQDTAFLAAALPFAWAD